MACFLVPATEAAVTTIAEHVVKGKEERANKEELTLSENSKTPFSHKLKWLNHMLWGGSALLAFEHIWHGEVTPWFPFLTAAGNPEDAMAMLHEMATTGVAMAVLVTAVWAGMVAVSNVTVRLSEQVRRYSNDFTYSSHCGSDCNFGMVF